MKNLLLFSLLISLMGLVACSNTDEDPTITFDWSFFWRDTLDARGVAEFTKIVPLNNKLFVLGQQYGDKQSMASILGFDTAGNKLWEHQITPATFTSPVELLPWGDDLLLLVKTQQNVKRTTEKTAYGYQYPVLWDESLIAMVFDQEGNPKSNQELQFFKPDTTRFIKYTAFPFNNNLLVYTANPNQPNLLTYNKQLQLIDTKTMPKVNGRAPIGAYANNNNLFLTGYTIKDSRPNGMAFKLLDSNFAELDSLYVALPKSLPGKVFPLESEGWLAIANISNLDTGKLTSYSLFISPDLKLNWQQKLPDSTQFPKQGHWVNGNIVSCGSSQLLLNYDAHLITYDKDPEKTDVTFVDFGITESISDFYLNQNKDWVICGSTIANYKGNNTSWAVIGKLTAQRAPKTN